MKTKVRQIYDYVTWRKWFAWYPVKVDIEHTKIKRSVKWVWLETIERKEHTCDFSLWYYDYRFVNETTKTKSI